MCPVLRMGYLEVVKSIMKPLQNLSYDKSSRKYAAFLVKEQILAGSCPVDT